MLSQCLLRDAESDDPTMRGDIYKEGVSTFFDLKKLFQVCSFHSTKILSSISGTHRKLVVLVTSRVRSIWLRF